MMTRTQMRYLIGLGGGLVLAAALWLGLFLAQLGTPLGGSVWVDELYAKKLARAAALERPKIAVVAGSNALFGLRSPLLEAAWGRPVVNLGVNAGLRPPLVLEIAKPALRPGDIVLLPLEYSMYVYDGQLNATFTDYVLSRADVFGTQDLWTQIRLMAVAPVSRVLQGLRGLPPDYAPGGLYGPHMVDDWGDQIESELARRTPGQHAGAQAGGPQRYGAEAPAEPAIWAVLTAFQAWADEQDICLIFVPPAFMAYPEYRDDPVEAAFYGGLAARAAAQGLTYLGDPYAFMHPPEDFFDTNYHLVAEARAVWTQRLIETVGPDPERWCAP